MKVRKPLSILLCILMLVSLCVPATFSSDSGTEKDYKNIIIMIGDGMGENHLKLAEEYGYNLFMNTHYDLRGQSKTRSLSHSITDSAAGGTALSSGTRIINQTVGVYAFDLFGLFTRPKSISEVAQEKGMKTGIVTTDNTTGATPASFSVHVPYRKWYSKLAEEELKTNFDLFWGHEDENTEITQEEVEANGWTYISDYDEMDALEPGSKSFGQFPNDMWRTRRRGNSPMLDEMSRKAIELLNADNENGFFLMIEGAHIDKQSHKSDDDVIYDYNSKRAEAVDAVVAFDRAIEDVVEFAREDGHTVVLVTADHETGLLFEEEDGKIRYHSNEHTSYPVPVFVYGNDTIIEPGEVVKNYTIPGRLTALLGWSKNDLPSCQDGLLIAKLKSIGLLPS